MLCELAEKQKEEQNKFTISNLNKRQNPFITRVNLIGQRRKIIKGIYYVINLLETTVE